MKSFSVGFAADVQKELLLCWSIQNHIDLRLFLIRTSLPHRLLPLRDRCQACFKDDSSLGISPEKKHTIDSPPLAGTKHYVGVEWGRRRCGGEKRPRVASDQFQWLKGKHLFGLGSREHKPGALRTAWSWEQTAFKTNATSFVGFWHDSLGGLIQTIISTCRFIKMWPGYKIKVMFWVFDNRHPSHEYVTFLPPWTLYIVWLWSNPSTQGEK